MRAVPDGPGCAHRTWSAGQHPHGPAQLPRSGFLLGPAPPRRCPRAFSAPHHPSGPRPRRSACSPYRFPPRGLRRFAPARWGGAREITPRSRAGAASPGRRAASGSRRAGCRSKADPDLSVKNRGVGANWLRLAIGRISLHGDATEEAPSRSQQAVTAAIHPKVDGRVDLREDLELAFVSSQLELTEPVGHLPESELRPDP